MTMTAFGRQGARLRIEALMAVGGYDAPGAVMLSDFGDGASMQSSEAAKGETAEGVTAGLERSTSVTPDGAASACYRARSDRPGREGSWAKIGWEFPEPLDLSAHRGLGVWVHGDARGEVLNFQVRSPESVALGIGEHYVVVDFEGWRYFELAEFEGQRCGDYVWPYSRDLYGIFRESVNYAAVGTLSVWYNNLPPGEDVECHVGPIKALPLVKTPVRNPSITIGGDQIRFPVDIEPGTYLEVAATDECTLYGPDGAALQDVAPEGRAPCVEAGGNHVRFASDVTDGERPRARVTVITDGDPLPDVHCP